MGVPFHFHKVSKSDAFRFQNLTKEYPIGQVNFLMIVF